MHCNPTISVILPVYNGTDTIRATVNSVLGQSFTDFELLIINDGSTDDTLNILNAFADQRIRILSYANEGLASSRNRGITQARGGFISFIDADDLWATSKLASQYRVLEAAADADVAYSWTDFIDEEDHLLRGSVHHSSQGHVLPQLLKENFIASGSNVLVRAQLFKKVGLFDTALKAAEDWDMWLRMAAEARFVCDPQPQIYYRLRNSSMSADIEPMLSSQKVVAQRAIAGDPARLEKLKRPSYGNIYAWLAYRSVTVFPSAKKIRQPPGNGWLGLRFLALSLWFDPSVLKKPSYVLAILYRSLLLLLGLSTKAPRRPGAPKAG